MAGVAQEVGGAWPLIPQLEETACKNAGEIRGINFGLLILDLSI